MKRASRGMKLSKALVNSLLDVLLIWAYLSTNQKDK